MLWKQLSERDTEWIIDQLLVVKGWRDNPQDPNCNITRQSVFVEYKSKIGTKKPDYVFYDNLRSPLCILECKKPKNSHNTLDKALEQAKKYAQKIDCPLVIATDGFVYRSYHLNNKY